MVTDHQGSVEAKVDATGTIVTAHQAYKPYGQPRTAGGFATQRGWIGQIEDTTTGLNYLNARYYDPTLTRFISPDPLYNPAQIKTLNPYTYAWGNPVTASDPSGLFLFDDGRSASPPPSNVQTPTIPGGGGGGGGGGAGGSGGAPRPRTSMRSKTPSEAAQTSTAAIKRAWRRSPIPTPASSRASKHRSRP